MNYPLSTRLYSQSVWDAITEALKEYQWNNAHLPDCFAPGARKLRMECNKMYNKSGKVDFFLMDDDGKLFADQELVQGEGYKYTRRRMNWSGGETCWPESNMGRFNSAVQTALWNQAQVAFEYFFRD